MTSKKKTEFVVEPGRSATVTIGGEDYELVLTTKATRLIAERYGGLEHLATPSKRLMIWARHSVR